MSEQRHSHRAQHSEAEVIGDVKLLDDGHACLPESNHEHSGQVNEIEITGAHGSSCKEHRVAIKQDAASPFFLPLFHIPRFQNALNPIRFSIFKYAWIDLHSPNICNLRFQAGVQVWSYGTEASRVQRSVFSQPYQEHLFGIYSKLK